MSFEAAYIEEVEKREESMAVDGEPDAKPKIKRVIKKKEVAFVTRTSSLDASILEKYKEQEGQMHASDKLVMETEVRILVIWSTSLRLSYMDRIVKILSRSMPMTPVVNWTTVIVPTFSNRRRRNSSWRSKMLRTSSTLRKERSQRSLLTYLVSTH